MASRLLKFDLRQNLFRIPSTIRVTMGLQWNFVGAEPVDLDASAVSFDENGVALEAVFFNNLKSENGYMEHSGDNTTGEDTGDDDERITWDLARVPDRVQHIMVCVTSYTGADFTLVELASCRLYNDVTKETVGEFSLGILGRHTGTLLCVMSRIPPQAGEGEDKNTYWDLRELNIPCMGFTFFDVMGKMLDILAVPDNEQRAECLYSLPDYSLEKDSGKLDHEAVLGQMKLGLGWDGENDLDAILVMLNAKDEYIDHVYAKHGKLHSKDAAAAHSGDKLNGYDVEGDDEFISLDVHKLAPAVQTVFFVVTLYSGFALHFSSVPNSYVRVQNKPSPVDLNYREIDRFAITKNGGENTALIFSSITRKGTNVFQYKKLHELTQGKDWIDVFPIVRRLAVYKEQLDLDEWNTWKQSALKSFAVEVCFLEARDLSPLEPHHFACHCQAWVMDRKCIGNNRAYKSPVVYDRDSVKWTTQMDIDPNDTNAAAPISVSTAAGGNGVRRTPTPKRRVNVPQTAIFLVNQLDRIRIMLFEHAMVGIIDVEMNDLAPKIFAGETVDEWMRLQGVGISGELRLSIRHVPSKYAEAVQARNGKKSGSWCSIM